MRKYFGPFHSMSGLDLSFFKKEAEKAEEGKRKEAEQANVHMAVRDTARQLLKDEKKSKKKKRR